MLFEWGCRNSSSEESPQGVLFNATTAYLLITPWEGGPDLPSALSFSGWPARPSLTPCSPLPQALNALLSPSEGITALRAGAHIYRVRTKGKYCAYLLHLI